LAPIRKSRGIKIFGNTMEGFAKINIVTNDLKEAIENTKYIFICTQAHAHKNPSVEIGKLVKDDQIIILLPGYWGFAIFYKNIRLEHNKKVKIVESRTLPYACSRIEEKAEVNIQMTTNSHLASIPASETPYVISEIDKLYPNRFASAKNVLEVAINAAGLFQTAMSILSTSYIEPGKDSYHFKQGYTPSVLKVLRAIWKEKNDILKYLNLSDLFPFEELEKMLLNPTSEQLTIKRPNNMYHRYITENCPLRLVPMSSLGLFLRIPTPITNSLINLASIINDIDYNKDGRTIKKLGFKRLLKINEFVEFFE
jgi:opine dehydrogenase